MDFAEAKVKAGWKKASTGSPSFEILEKIGSQDVEDHRSRQNWSKQDMKQAVTMAFRQADQESENMMGTQSCNLRSGKWLMAEQLQLWQAFSSPDACSLRIAVHVESCLVARCHGEVSAMCISKILLWNTSQVPNHTLNEFTLCESVSDSKPFH
jgi:hypothetical protein